MINTNKILMDFAEGNFLAVGMAIYMLKWIGRKTPWSWDDDVGDAVSGMFGFLKKNGKTTINDNQQQ